MEDNMPCPYYAKKKVCCNRIQIQQLDNNFKDIEMIFGTDCPICGLNLKLFWCEFVCNQNQSQFIFPHNVMKIKHGNSMIDVLNITFLLSAETTCAIFKSCSKVPETRRMASSGQGFIQFQGNHAADRGRTWMNFEFTDKIEPGRTPLKFQTFECNTDPINGTLRNFTNITKCSCSYCEKSCEVRNEKFEPPGYFQGFNPIIVGISYLVLGVITAITYFCYRRLENKKEKDKDRDKDNDKDKDKDELNINEDSKLEDKLE